MGKRFYFIHGFNRLTVIKEKRDFLY
jgi:hypothetical protein